MGTYEEPGCGLYFKMETIEVLKEKLDGKARIIEIVAQQNTEEKK